METTAAIDSRLEPTSVIEALAAALRDSPSVRLDEPDEVYRRLFITGILPSQIGRNWNAVIDRAREMRAECAKVAA